MTFEETLAKVRKIAEETDVTGRDFLAVQVNLTDPDGGVFYVEVKDGKAAVEPYEYNNRQCAVTMDTESFNKLLDGELNPILAFSLGKLKVEGDMGKALEFSKLIQK